VSDIIKKYIQGGSGQWLTVNNCNIGAVVDIETMWIDEDSFPDQPPGLCVGGVYNGAEECQVRLSKTNARRISETLGDENWVGQKIKCVFHADYPGIKEKGLVWDGVPPEKEQKEQKKLEEK